MKIIERIFDAQTGETNDIEREMTADELRDYEDAQTKMAIKAKEEKDIAKKRQIVLDKLSVLGLTLDDIQALGL